MCTIPFVRSVYDLRHLLVPYLFRQTNQGRSVPVHTRLFLEVMKSLYHDLSSTLIVHYRNTVYLWFDFSSCDKLCPCFFLFYYGSLPQETAAHLFSHYRFTKRLRNMVKTWPDIPCICTHAGLTSFQLMIGGHL